MSRVLFAAALLLSVAALIASVAQPALAQTASTQVVFSGTGSGVFNTKTTHFGFWIWCEGAPSNPYAGVCNGAMYFYALGITRPVSGVVTGTKPAFVMNVHSPGTTPAVKCTLNNVAPVTSGPTNTVNVACSSPSGSGSSSTAVVNVTGP